MHKNMILFNEKKAIVSEENGNMEFRDNTDNLKEILSLENNIEYLTKKYEEINKKMIDYNEIRRIIKALAVIGSVISVFTNLISSNLLEIAITLPIIGILSVASDRILFNNIKILSIKKISTLNVLQKYKDNLKKENEKSKPIEYNKEKKEELEYTAVASISYGIKEKTKIENEVLENELNHNPKVRERRR